MHIKICKVLGNHLKNNCQTMELELWLLTPEKNPLLFFPFLYPSAL